LSDSACEIRSQIVMIRVPGLARSGTMKKTIAVLVAGSIFLLAGPGRTGDKDSRWKKFLPGEAYKELVEREVKILQECLKGTPEEKVLDRAKLAATMIAAL